MISRLLLFFLLGFMPCFAQDLPPHGLMVEFLRAPEIIEIKEAKPDFSWTLPATLGKQTGWQIQVSSTKELLNQGTPDFWDSGKIPEEKSINIEYEGKSLTEYSTYHWKVRVLLFNSLV